MLVLKFFICVSVSFVWAVENDSNNEAAGCKEFVCRHGYKYDTFFSVDSVKRSTDPNVVFEMHIAILAPSNGHIVLSFNPYPTPLDSVYEIVVGGGGNKFTELRRNLRRNAKASNRTVDILSANEFRPFYIRLLVDGTVEFGRYTDPLPIISFFDVNPLRIGFFSFAAWNGVEAKFRFDCPFPKANKTQPSSKSEPVTRNLTNTEKLKKNLLQDRVPYLQPSSSMVVKLGIVVEYLRFDPVDSILTTGLSAVMAWEDDSMAWNPDKFFNISYVRFSEGQIWQPKFLVTNSISALPLENQQMNQPIYMINSGVAMFHLYTEIRAYCFDHEWHSSWPQDEYTCYLVIQPWENHENFKMIIMEELEFRYDNGANSLKTTKNEWDWSVDVKIVNATFWNKVMYNSYNDLSTHNGDRILIQLQLKRTAATYNIVFYTPLLVLITFVLMSFWTETLKMSRIWFYVGVTMVLCIGLCYIDDLVPSNKVPFILIFYITVLSGVLTALLVQIILMTETAKNWCHIRSEQIQSSSLLRIMFCLPKMKTCQNYETVENCSLDDESSGIYEHSTGNIEELQSDNVEYDSRVILAECVDKFMFIVYSVTIAVMLGKATM